MADNDRDTLAALIAEHLPVTNTRPYGDETDPGEVFVEGFAELLDIADAILARWKLGPRDEDLPSCAWCGHSIGQHHSGGCALYPCTCTRPHGGY